MKEFTLVVTDKEVMQIANALGKLPFEQVFALITKLDKQLIEQQQKETQVKE